MIIRFHCFCGAFVVVRCLLTCFLGVNNIREVNDNRRSCVEYRTELAFFHELQYLEWSQLFYVHVQLQVISLFLCWQTLCWSVRKVTANGKVSVLEGQLRIL